MLCTKLVKPTEKHHFLPLGRMGSGIFFLLDLCKKGFCSEQKKRKRAPFERMCGCLCVCVFLTLTFFLRALILVAH